tara:strand:- start:3042 stop:3434 length:393 start_codon:yes stop_codon:yes gene_type:complete
MTNFPKKGKVTGSSWVTRGYAKQFGVANAIGSGVSTYKKEKQAGKSNVAAATSGVLKGGAKGLGTYAGTIVGTKLGGKLGGLVGGTVGGAVTGGAYEIGKKTFKMFTKKKTPYNKTRQYKALPQTSRISS